MASFSNPTFSGKAPTTDAKNLGKMSFLDMSLDDIIILRKIEYPNFEENKNETQNEREKYSVPTQQSNAGEHRRHRGSSISRNKTEERKDKELHQGTSGFKSGQSSSNRKSLTKQEKYSDNSKAQVKRNGGQSEKNQHQSEGSQRQSEENRHCSERSRGHYYQSERSRGKSERSRSPRERSHGHPERSLGHSERSHDHFERSRGQTERSRSYSERSHGHSERSHDRSGRSHDRSGRYRRYSPVGRFRTSPKIRNDDFQE